MHIKEHILNNYITTCNNLLIQKLEDNTQCHFKEKNTCDDRIYGYTGDNTYMYNRVYAKDTIADTSGTNTLLFTDGIASSDLAVRTLDNGDMLIAIKEDGINFENLADKITVKNYTTNKINIKLHDGTSIDIDSLQVATDGDDVMKFGDSGVTFDALGGNDNITSGSGGVSMCIELKIANNVLTCSLHIEQKYKNKKVA